MFIRQLYIVPFCLRETFGITFSLVKSSRNAWRRPASVKATKWWRVFWEQRTLNFTWLYRSSVTTDSTCQTGEHCLEQEGTSASANLLNNIFDTIFYCPVGQRSQALALLNAEQIVIRRARDFLNSKWSDIFAVLKIILFEVDSVMNSFTDVIFTYKMMVSF